ncbi:MAG: type II secretion system ATPase GspE [Gammaproteobacteria bacterium]|nr:type II secretion system ATPase GspE [Gammaproteobacteria bacterium]MCY4282289.1 type II secretion system ATPase GspE [Gammaproteobacteria bacterium]MCY4339466.1 type II secretion system ATPase GspE [Gammaproteobacteria bacterium]
MMDALHNPTPLLAPIQAEAGAGAEAATKWSFGFAKRHGVVAVPDEDSSGLRVLHRADVSLLTLAEVRRFLGVPVRYECVDAGPFQQALTASYESGSDTALKIAEGLEDDLDLASLISAIPEKTDLLEQEDDAPVIRLINALLTEALKQNASDIHIETFEKYLSVRFRVDGSLRQVARLERGLTAFLVSRIKVMAKLDIAEKRVPQDGRISLRVAGREADIRVSVVPASEGERVVLRLLDKKAERFDLASLGMNATDLSLLRELLCKPHGIILVTGPTGSGKTTTLYAALSYLNEIARNIITVEDPIEYNLEGISQIQVNPKTGLTFADGLRAILRQDPDVIMLGEIRDADTAEIAIRASLTGHLVLATLHTNSAIGAVTRLQDMGIESFLLSSTLLGVIAQRLVRVLCAHCKQTCPPDEAHRVLSGLSTGAGDIIYRAVGCDHCLQTGYQGRTGIFEVVAVDDTLRGLIHEQAGEADMLKYTQQRFSAIRTSGMQALTAGATSLDEVLRVLE